MPGPSRWHPTCSLPAEGGQSMKQIALVLFVCIAASQVSAQVTKPGDTVRAGERQFPAEVVSSDAVAKTLSVKATGGKGETTLTLAVDDSVLAQIADLKPGDKVIVLWRQDEAGKRNVVVGIAKSPPASSN